MLIVQLSDLHLCLKEPLAAKNIFAQRAIDSVARLNPRPDAVILTGDLTEFGTPDEYAHLHRLLAPLDVPVFAIPGNHDERSAMRAHFPLNGSRSSDGPLNGVIETRPVRLIGLDSTIPGRVEGALSGSTLDFLEEALTKEPEVPTLIFVHHPPFLTGIESKDDIRLFEGAERFESIVSRHPQIERIVAGHYHRAIQGRFGKIICQIAPPVRYMTPAERDDPVEHESDDEMPGYLVHRWIAGTGLVTHLCPIPLNGAA